MRSKKIPGLLILCIAACVLPARAATISLNVSSPVQVGSTFDVVVQASNVFPNSTDLLFGYGFNVNFSSIFQYTGSTAGTLFDDFSGFPGGPAVAGFATLNAPYFGALGPLDISGPLTLATLHFTALASGTGSVGVTSNLLDPNEGLIYLDPNTPNADISGSIQITASVPEPAVVTLLIPGIAAVILLRRSTRAR